MQLVPAHPAVAAGAAATTTAIVGISARYPGKGEGDTPLPLALGGRVPHPLVAWAAGDAARVGTSSLPLLWLRHQSCCFTCACQALIAGLLCWALAAGLEGLWHGLYSSADLQREVPLARWDVDSGFDPSPTGQAMSVYVRFGAFCSGASSCLPRPPIWQHAWCGHCCSATPDGPRVPTILISHRVLGLGSKVWVLGPDLRASWHGPGHGQAPNFRCLLAGWMPRAGEVDDVDVRCEQRAPGLAMVIPCPWDRRRCRPV